jgi:hypothetical protein
MPDAITEDRWGVVTNCQGRKPRNQRQVLIFLVSTGCYLWKYGERKPLTMDQMKYQWDGYYHLLRNGEIGGLIFCSKATVPDPGIGEGVYVDHYSTLF